MPAPIIRPLTRADYDALVEAGRLDNEKVELIHGLIVHRMSPQKPPHASAVQALSEILLLALVPRFTIRVQSPLALGDDSEPEPDLAVVPYGSYRKEHPKTALLVIEVATSSLMRDKREKAALYAEYGVPEYWVVDTAHEQVEVHKEIVEGGYSRVTPYRVGEVVVFGDLQIPVADIFR